MDHDEPIYLDYHATTPVTAPVREAMWPWFSGAYGNASNPHHAYGRRAQTALALARQQVAHYASCEDRDVVFTSGATEANNLAIKGLAAARSQSARFLTCSTEHRAVLDPMRRLRRSGHQPEILPVSPDGFIERDTLAKQLDDQVALVSIMLVNNEIGTIQPIEEIVELCHARGIAVHCDAAQIGHIESAAKRLQGVDLISLSAHKLGGPQGVGALICRRAAATRPRLEPLIEGGGQELRLRSGTVPVGLCVGFAAACTQQAARTSHQFAQRQQLRDRLWQLLTGGADDLQLNGPPLDSRQRCGSNLNFSIPGVDGELLLQALDRVAVSSGSACSATSPDPSHVLTAIGRTAELARASLRMAIGWETTEEHIEQAAAHIGARIRTLREAQSKE